MQPFLSCGKEMAFLVKLGSTYSTMKKFLFLFIILFNAVIYGQEPYESNQTHTYDQVHDVYTALVKKYPSKCKLVQFGSSDYGKNIELFIISKEGHFQKEQFKNKSVLMINNAIHPGEPCGVDACVKLAKDLLSNDSKLPSNLVVGIIPMYNIGGAHNRTCCSRANQNGPEEYGFRGNAKNLDLNRDFIKADSKNTRTFYKIYHFLEPNIFVDTHTSDGADYKHIMTLITSQMDKMNPLLKEFTKEKLNPHLFAEMKHADYDMVPYVHTIKNNPEDGIMDYLETPRYSTGYTNLFNTISYVTETHMLKTFKERVESTYTFLDILIQYMGEHTNELIELKNAADNNTAQLKYIPLNWALDTSKFDWIDFKGYEAEYIKSSVTGQNRLLYNHEKPWEQKIKYFNRYSATDSVLRPDYYIIPQAWQDVIIRLQLSQIELKRLTQDITLEVEAYYIDDYSTVEHPYEGHYLHSKIEATKQSRQMLFRKGDFVVSTNNKYAQFIVQSLEPKAVDSYFAWNFFDAILQQKEWFSGYVFEETAQEMLNNDPKLKAEFDAKKKEDSEFATSGFLQLYYLYKRSPNYERTYNLYPVVRFIGDFESSAIEKAPLLIYGS